MDVSVEAELLLAGSDDGVVAVWSLADQQLIHFLLGHTGQSEIIHESSLIMFLIMTNYCVILIGRGSSVCQSD